MHKNVPESISVENSWWVLQGKMLVQIYQLSIRILEQAIKGVHALRMNYKMKGNPVWLYKNNVTLKFQSNKSNQTKNISIPAYHHGCWNLSRYSLGGEGLSQE